MLFRGICMPIIDIIQFIELNLNVEHEHLNSYYETSQRLCYLYRKFRRSHLSEDRRRIEYSP